MSGLRALIRWAGRLRADRRARLASLRPAARKSVDEQLLDFSQQMRRHGASYDTWRQALRVPRRGPHC